MGPEARDFFFTVNHHLLNSYDSPGRSTLSLVRRLIALRRRREEIRRGEHELHNQPEKYQDRGLLLYSWRLGDAFSLVALNFTDHDQETTFTFPIGGDYADELDRHSPLEGVIAGVERSITVPSHHGRVWSVGGPARPPV